jgi:natural product precursor
MESKKVRTLAKLKLNKLSENDLEKRAMKVLKGGCSDCDGYCASSGTAGVTDSGVRSFWNSY